MSNVLVQCHVIEKYCNLIGLNDPIEIFDNDETLTSSPSRTKKRPHHRSCASKEARYKALAF